MSDLSVKTFTHVLCEELEEIEKSREARRLTDGGGLAESAGPQQPSTHGGEGRQAGQAAPSPSKRDCSATAEEIYDQAAAKNLLGLSFSGGGIRSATFGLGILQTLARYGLLSRFDYLSTVSGGGYLGGWLTTWLRRQGLPAVTQGLTGEGARPDEPEVLAIRYLRQFSNYLTPKTGFFSADTWTMIAIYLRNVILNMTILVLALGAGLIIPKLIAFGTQNLDDWLGIKLLVALTILAALPAVYFIVRNLAAISASPDATEAEGKTAQASFTYPGAVQSLIVAPIFASAWLLSVVFIAVPDSWRSYTVWLALAVAAMVLLLGSFSRHGAAYHLARFGAVVVGGLTGAGALYYVFPGLRDGVPWAPATQLEFLSVEQAQTIWGVPLMIVIFSLAGTFYIGFMGNHLSTIQREWWGRLGAWLLIYSIVWAGLFVIALGSAGFVTHTLEPWISTLLASGWLATTVGGLFAGKSSSTGGKDPSPWMELLAKVAPYVFVFGLLVLLAVAVDDAGEALRPGWANEPLSMIAAAVGLVGLSLLLSWRVDINQFSMHNFYRNRLVRCYVGASDENRRPHRFTDFDRKEHYVRISDLLVNPKEDPDNAKRPRDFAYPIDQYKGPYHIVNVALNLVSGENLAWQKRQASSFVFTPKYSGYGNFYRPTANFDDGMSLGTAVTISGAAASPNMGYHTSTPLAFLMTVFNVRLGWWLGNPAHKAWKKPGPPVGLPYLFYELFALTDSSRNFVYLSDGGHFENLGIYELVRRRCQYIVVCDGEEDADLKFDGLGNAIEKCRTDLGIDVEIDVDLIARTKEDPKKGSHCAVGRIRYDKLNPNLTEGTILYIKSSLTGDEPTDVERYDAQNEAFPHESTGDQWFDETQFESYRMLGEHIADTVLGAVGTKAEVQNMPTEELFVKLRQQWYAPSDAIAASFSRHAAGVDRIFNEIRTTKELRFLDAQIYPEWPKLVSDPGINDKANCVADRFWLPKNCDEVRAGFYISQQVIQLMESVYLDLNLEREHSHPDNRGWMNFFRHWSWAGMFRISWAISASTYGARFQEFCRRHLDLEVGEVTVGKAVPVPSDEKTRADKCKELEDSFVLNFFEVNLLRKLTASSANQRNYQVYPLQIKTSVPEREGQISFTFGFALTEGKTLCFLRVQDHLRRSGLGRQALVRLIKSQGIVELDMSGVPEQPEFPSRAETSDFRRRFDSVLVELGKPPTAKTTSAGAQ